MDSSVAGPSSAPVSVQLSQYSSNLSTEEYERYVQKISLIGIDPYLVSEAERSHKISQLPDVNSMDIMAYLITTPSPYTSKNFKAYKSSEAYNQFANGWLHDTSVYIPKDHPDIRVVCGKVSFPSLCY